MLARDVQRSLITLKMVPSSKAKVTVNDDKDTPFRKFELPPDDEFIIDGEQVLELITLESSALIDARIVQGAAR